MTEVLNITDGTTTLNLLDNTSIKLIEWLPAIAVPKTVSRGSELSDFQSPISRTYDNIVETFRLYIVGSSQNTVAVTLNNIFGLLEEAVLYHTSEAALGALGYITAKSDSETNTRYAVIYNYRVEQIPQVFQDSPFKIGALSAGDSYASSLEEIVLVIERGHWMDQAPFAGTAIAVSSTFTFNSATYGQAATTADQVMAANKHNYANITHIYRYDASTTTYSSNLAAETAYNIFPNSTAANDAIYFGSRTSINGSGPFSNLIFDIVTAAVGSIGVTWEYWDGNSWESIGFNDIFSIAGIKVFSFEQPADWATNAINSITAYWLRCRITGATLSTIPAQGNRRIYSQTAPYIEIDTNQKGGVLSPRARISIRSQSGDDIGGVVGGFRAVDRGADFSAYFNFNVWQSAVDVSGGPDGGLITVTTDLTSPYGVTGVYNLGGTLNTPTRIAYWLIQAASASQYVGKFRVFLRGYCVVADQFWVQVTNDNGSVTYYTSSAGSFPATNYISLLDLGLVSIPKLSTTFAIGIYTERTVTSVADPLGVIMDMILIPADEYTFTTYSPVAGGVGILTSTTSYLAVDGFRDTEMYSTVIGKSVIGIPTPDEELLKWIMIASGGPTMDKAKTQRLWLTTFMPANGIFPYLSRYNSVYSVQIEQSKRYLALRGSE